ncbi:MAG: formate dehydrogenase accessory sulfurtransferase FdhD [Opitutaceae bacterium]|nr:formate dehydrogenase accessory sulfurtransferase FdhD [Opitutaceae bacterium]
MLDPRPVPLSRKKITPARKRRIRPAAAGERIAAFPSLHWSREDGWSSVTEQLAGEAPLAIEVAYERLGQPVSKVLAVTMRTPGSDEELALGFLFGEGLIECLADTCGNTAAGRNSRGEVIATRTVRLVSAPREDLQRVSRGLITSSACGLCSRATLKGLPFGAPAADAGPVLSCELIASLPDRLRDQQDTFSKTGGTHGAALFDVQGGALLVREDVGRHNAVDKLIGAALLGKIALAGKILVLSGRVSFELMQKAAAAGVAVVVAVGAPSSIAVNLAHTAGITLIGFARGARFNVYAHAERLEPGPSGKTSVPPKGVV